MTPLLAMSKLIVFFIVLFAGTPANAEDKSLENINEKDLLAWFKKHEGKPRLVVFFSPT